MLKVKSHTIKYFKNKSPTPSNPVANLGYYVIGVEY
jgi:hypothetical protein